MNNLLVLHNLHCLPIGTPVGAIIGITVGVVVAVVMGVIIAAISVWMCYKHGFQCRKYELPHDELKMQVSSFPTSALSTVKQIIPIYS